MFLRRKKRHPLRKVGDIFWPEIGFQRMLRYLWLRLARMPGTPYSIAAGFACGAAVSMTPFVGLHFVISAALAWMIGANVVAGLIGTVVGNPWTFPFIWAFVHTLGQWILPGPGVGEPVAREFTDMFGRLMEDLLTFNMASIAEYAWPILWPMLVGSIPTAIVAWIVVYLPLRRLISGFQQSRHKRHLRKMDARPGFSEQDESNGP